MQNETNNINNFVVDFIAAQSEMQNASKDSTNPHFKKSYASLNSIIEACRPILNKHGIAILQPTVHIDGRNFVKTVLRHKSGDEMFGLTEIIYAKQNDAQAQGSAITYARRYGLQSLVTIGAEDDDGNAASKDPNAKPAKLKNVADDENMKKLIEEKKPLSDVDKLARYKEKIESFGSTSELEAWLEEPKVKGAMERLKDELRGEVVDLIINFKNKNFEL